MINLKKPIHLGVGLVVGTLALLAAIPAVALAHYSESSHFATTIPLAQTNPGVVTQSLSFLDLDWDGSPDDLNRNGIIGEPGLAPLGDQTTRLDRVGQVFEGTINQVTSLAPQGNVAVEKLTGAGLAVTFNSTIFLGPEIMPGVHAIFGKVTGTAQIKRLDGSLTLDYYGNLGGTLDLVTGAVTVADTGHCWASSAAGEMNSLKSINADFSAQASGLVGYESALITLTGVTQ